MKLKEFPPKCSRQVWLTRKKWTPWKCRALRVTAVTGVRAQRKQALAQKNVVRGASNQSPVRSKWNLMRKAEQAVPSAAHQQPRTSCCSLMGLQQSHDLQWWQNSQRQAAELHLQQKHFPSDLLTESFTLALTVNPLRGRSAGVATMLFLLPICRETFTVSSGKNKKDRKRWERARV